MEIPIGGTYTDWGDNKETQIPEGVYTVDFNQWDLTNGDINFLAWDGPFYVKTSDPKIAFDPVEEEIDGTEYVVSGSIDDKFVDFATSVNWSEIFGTSYDVNQNLTVTYQLADKNGNVVRQWSSNT